MSPVIEFKHGQARPHRYVASRRQHDLVITRAMSWRLASRHSWLSVFCGIVGHESTAARGLFVERR